MAQNTAAVLGLQKEKILNSAIKLYTTDETTLQGKLMSNKGRGVERVSKRALKIPLVIKNGGLAGMASFDGGVLGPGGGPTTTAGYVSTVGLIFASEATAESEWGTDSTEKAILSTATLDAENAMDSFKSLIDTLLFTAGDGVLATVTGVSGSNLTVDSPSNLQDGNNYYIVSADGNYTNRGTVSVNTVDVNNKLMALTAAAPTGTVTGDYVVINNGSGVPGTSILGIYASQVNNANTGSWQTINRATYPGKLQAQYVNAAGATVTPQMLLLASGLRKRALGNKTANEVDFVWVGDVEQEASWQALALNYTQIQRDTLGDRAQDLLTKDASATIGGRPFIVTTHARRGRLDGVSLKNWGISATRELGQYKVGNTTVFPHYDTASGTITSSNISYLCAEMQAFCQNPMSGVFIGGIGATAGF